MTYVSSKKNLRLGILFALLAAILNSSIGVFNEFSFLKGGGFSAIAFYKTFLAFIILLIGTFFSTKYRLRVWNIRCRAKEICLMSFFGVFILYYFETYAFSLSNIPLTSFMIYVPGFISVILGYIFLKEKLSIKKILVFFTLLIGAYLLLVGTVNLGFKVGLIYAFVGGAGYSIFIFLSKLFKLEDALATLWWMFMFGSLMLFVPLAISGNYIMEKESLFYVLLLAIFPTIGGFLMTLLAAKYISGGTIQLVETSDPLFATMFAIIIFNQGLTVTSSIGAIIILISLICLSLIESSESSELMTQEIKNIRT